MLTIKKGGSYMSDINWQEMLSNQQTLYQFSRTILSHTQKQFLTASERELLAWIYLHPTNCTPLLLSKMSGMKKEAVSRCLKQLFQKECIEKKKLDTDERSYYISLTEKGEKELKRDYEILLQSFYDLYREMQDDFILLFSLISKANLILSNNERSK